MLRCFDLNCNNLEVCILYGNTLFVFLSFANSIIKIDLDSGKVVSKKELCPNIDYILVIEKKGFASYEKDGKHYALELVLKIYKQIAVRQFYMQKLKCVLKKYYKDMCK